MKRKRWISIAGCLAACILCLPVSAKAAETTAQMAQYAGVEVSHDGLAWTTDRGDKTNEILPKGYTYETGIPSRIRSLKEGEHYYAVDAKGSVNIGKWVVAWPDGQCVHWVPSYGDTFHGFSVTDINCLGHYLSGWYAYCADCGEKVADMFIYAKRATVQNILSMPAESFYLYICPHCNGLEQGVGYKHQCRDISYNRYSVVYLANTPEDGGSTSGFMARTRHLYGNAEIYEGRPAEESGYTDQKLRQNTYQCEGYRFTGWNTQPDGSGQMFSDGQEVVNLTGEQNGVVKLYAQWEKTQSTLLLDADGGTYAGEGIYERIQDYLSTYEVESTLLLPPAGYQVTFEVNGGSAVSPVTTTKSLLYWEKQEGFAGEFWENVFTFSGDGASISVLKARYQNDPFLLPDSEKADESLAGWYTDPKLTEESFVGKPGDEVVVDQNTVLYAKWAVLTLWAYDDYTSHDGVGAVDLVWEQKDGLGKFYKLYQSKDQVTWEGIHTTDLTGTGNLSRTFDTDAQGSTFTVEQGGYYTLTASGAKGGDHSTVLTGGAGAEVSASYWLKKGDVLTLYAGTAGSGTAGGVNGTSSGGGASDVGEGSGGGAATEVHLTREGVTHVLLIAGGGGGANAKYAGGAGQGIGTGSAGSTGSVGTDGAGGGGGGAPAGTGGTYTASVQQITMQKLTNRTMYIPYTYVSAYVSPYTLKSTGTETINGSRYYIYKDINLGTIYSTQNQICFNPEGNAVSVSGSYLAMRYVRTCSSGNCLATGYGYHHALDGVCNSTLNFYQKTVTQQGMSYTSSSGGGSYICTDFGCKDPVSTSGSNTGDGVVTLESLDVGYLEETKLEDVQAKDLAAPDVITEYHLTKSGVSEVKVTVTAPEDFGTIYYHKAESYTNDGTELVHLITSNVTENELVTGVKGYRYYVDGSEVGNVDESHAWSANGGISVIVGEEIQYLHVAAVDGAGNIGPTTVIRIAAQTGEDIPLDPDYMEENALYTRKLSIEDTDYVYEASEDIYYVKADGETEHVLHAAGYVDGTVTNAYQIDSLRLISSYLSTGEWVETQVPKVDISVEEVAFSNQELSQGASAATLLLWTPSGVSAARTAYANVLSVEQLMIVDTGQDGKQITVYPSAFATYEEKTYSSEEGADKENRITIIPDGVPPVIDGLNKIREAGNLDMTQDSKEFVLTAKDSGSGLKEFTVTIVNQDNHMARTYTSDTGSITIFVEKTDYLFMGDFAVTAEAADHVGNITTMGEGSLAFTLEAYVERMRSPHDGDFKAGDGGKLVITTGGYADKVIIRFPDALVALNAELNKEYVYEYPEVIKIETYEFSVPLGTEPGSYLVEVEAWKGDRKLTEKLQLPVKTRGSILEELCTRIRDNGV